jgi:hypothetical protein
VETGGYKNLQIEQDLSDEAAHSGEDPLRMPSGFNYRYTMVSLNFRRWPGCSEARSGMVSRSCSLGAHFAGDFQARHGRKLILPISYMKRHNKDPLI